MITGKTLQSARMGIICQEEMTITLTEQVPKLVSQRHIPVLHRPFRKGDGFRGGEHTRMKSKKAISLSMGAMKRVLCSAYCMISFSTKYIRPFEWKGLARGNDDCVVYVLHPPGSTGGRRARWPRSPTHNPGNGSSVRAAPKTRIDAHLYYGSGIIKTQER